MTDCLFEAAAFCLRAAAPEDKLQATFAAAEAFQAQVLRITPCAAPPQPICMPGRPLRPHLVHPRALPKRGLGTTAGRSAFIHAVAHIEFNAIDLAWDAVYRFRGMPELFYADWVGVACDEARHFTLLRARLQAHGVDYGDFDAHNGLWEMAEKTAHDVLERMALVPRVLEARGLDVTPGMIVRLREIGDDASADVLALILREEVAHVAAGSRWFRWCCQQRGMDPEPTFRALLAQYARAVLNGPFNHAARRAAGFSEAEMDALMSAVADASATHATTVLPMAAR